MIEPKNDVDNFIKFLDDHKESIAIYGTGEAGRLIWDSVANHLGYNIDCFIDRETVGECCELSVRELKEIGKEAGVIIAADPSYKIEERIEAAGLSDWIYIDPVFLSFYCNSDDYCGSNEKRIADNSADIKKVRELLFDELSSQILDEALSQRVCPNLKSIIRYYDKGQYFGNDVIPEITGNVVDCGAYTGDTLKRYLRQAKGTKWMYYAFEGDSSNCDQIRKFAENNGITDEVNIYNYAVWDEETVLTFDNPTSTSEMTSGRVSDNENGVRVNAARLDHLLFSPEVNTEIIDLITMDIEGAELNALNGARGIIKKYHPALAISIYHKTEHLWKIPLLIHEMDEGYRLFIRHHRWNMADTVCYGIWRES